MDVSSASPLALFAGGATTVSAKWTSEPLTVSYEGAVRGADSGRLDGAIDAKVPSVRRAIAWTEAGLSTGSAIGSIQLQSRVTGNRDNITLKEAMLTVDENTGRGELRLARGSRSLLEGRMAFDQLDLQSFVSIFTPLMSYDGDPSSMSESLIHKADFNLELAVATASLDGSQLSDLNGRMTARNGKAMFDVTQAKGFGGTVNGAFGIDLADDTPRTEIRVNATNIEGAAFGTATGFASVAPHAQGDVAFELSGVGQSLDTMLTYADGTLSAHFGKGELDGIDLEALVSKTASGGFFPLSDIAKGTLHIDGSDLEATIVHGVGRIQKAELRSGPRIVFLSGILPYAGRGVALSGTVASREKVSLFNPNGREASFFVGGSWDAPFVSAALPPQTLQ